MKFDRPLRPLCLKSLLIATVIFDPSISFSQDLGSIAGALIQGAINAQRMQQFQYQQRRQDVPRRRSRDSRESPDPASKQQANSKKAEDARQQHDAFLKIAPAANELIEDASTFVKGSPANPKLVAFIKQIGELNSALAAEDLSKLKPLMEGLVRDLRHEPGYEKLEAERSKQKREDAARYLPELIRTAGQQQAFIRYYITNNPTASYTGAFIHLLDDLDTNVAAPDLGKLTALTSKVDVAIREAHLQDDFVTSKNVLGRSGPADKPIDSSMLRKTEKNAFLSDGDRRDFILLYNSSPQAPHVTRNLSGTITFENQEATACLYEPNFDEAQRRLMKQKLISEYRLQKPGVDSRECSRSSLLTYDVIAVERGHLAQMRSEHQIALYSEVEANHFKHLETITSGRLDEILADQKKAQARIQADIESGSGEGYGIVEASPRVNTICMVVKDQEAAHRQLLQEKVELSTSDIISKPTLDDAYKALQRDECQAIYSAGPELKILTAAMAKDGADHSISAIWNRDEEIQKADRLAQAKREEDARQALLAKTQQEAREDLRRTMNAEESATARARQEALQSQFGKVAAAYSAAIAKDVRDATASRDDWQQSAGYAQYPRFVTWYQNMVRDHWELQSLNSEIADYGRAEWKGRPMETGFTLITIRLRNRILGEYKDVCVVLGRMNDTEFGMMRDPTEVACDQTAQSALLKKARNFESQWLVQPQS